eukprot:TRINITY_DN1521_c0_g1_i3.p1 TRINITY_DN1521_c0_g1~~TRINITY_DN1521_c0_g1_i3.p1  ORF type:complete len:357 (-),score=71.95 TRINITY_DN1521_c0_g1_i3:150-1220(-)
MDLWNVTAVVDPRLEIDVEDVDYDYEITVCAVMIPVGLFLCAVGPRFTQLAMVFGLSVGSDVGFFLTGLHIVAFGVGAGFGLFLGGVMACIHAVMYLFLGGMTAFLVFNYGAAPAIDQITTPTPLILGIALGVCVLVGALVAHFFRKWVVLLLSAFFGGYFLVNGVGGLIRNYRLNWIWIFYTKPEFECSDERCYGFYGGWAGIVLVTVLFHAWTMRSREKKEKKDKYHDVNDDECDYDHDDVENQANSRRRKDKKRSKSNKYRPRNKSRRNIRNDEDSDESDNSEYEMEELRKENKSHKFRSRSREKSSSKRKTKLQRKKKYSSDGSTDESEGDTSRGHQGFGAGPSLKKDDSAV